MASLRFLLALIVALAWAGPALARTDLPYPRISQANDATACRQALVVARRAFDSTAAKTADAAPLILTDKKPDFGILLAPGAHSPDGDEMIVDERAVQQQNGGHFTALFLQKATQGAHFVVTQQKMNWQGDFFGLHLVDATHDAEQTAEMRAGEKKTAAATIFKDSWQRPWLIRDPESHTVVAIDTQHPADVLADWIVYRAANGVAERACHIAFRPPAIRAADLLPPGPARKLALLLDKIIGVPAQDEGTYRATDRVHVAAAHAVANLALRPWALEESHNSAAEIENGLRTWAQRSPMYRTQYARAKALYPRALRALASHYRHTLEKSQGEAATLAKQALARAYGAHFVSAKTKK